MLQHWLDMAKALTIANMDRFLHGDPHFMLESLYQIKSL